MDIDSTIIALITLLEKTSAFLTNCSQPKIVEQMIMRYYRFMQLKALYPNEHLVPTLDIEIVWQTHLLRPEMYRGDCLRLFRRVIDHSLLIDNIEESAKEQAFAKTCELYKECFGEQYCPLLENQKENETISAYCHSVLNYIHYTIPAYPYWDATCFKFTSEILNNHKNPFSFVEQDIILDSYWFEFFCTEMYRVGSNIVRNRPRAQQIALHSAMKRWRKSYERFLYVADKYSTMNKYHCIHLTYAVRTQLSLKRLTFIDLHFTDRHCLAFSYARTSQICRRL